MQDSTANVRVETKQVAKRAGIVMLGTLASRIAGAIRDPIIAASFSVASTDAFFVAFTIPNALRQLLGEGAASAAVIPVLVEVKERHGEARVKRFIQDLTGVATLVLLVVTVLGVLTAPFTVPLYAAGYLDDADKFALTVKLTRLCFPYLFFMGLTAIAMGVLHAHRHFFTPAFSPTLLNIALIGAAFLAPGITHTWGWEPITALCFGVLAGGVLQWIAHWPALAQRGLWMAPRFSIKDPAVSEVLKRLFPLLFGVGVYQLNVMISRLFASFLEDGAQSYLYYGQRLVEIPQGMAAIAIASAMMPSVAAFRSRNQTAEAAGLVQNALRMTLFIAIPSSLLLAFAAEPIVQLMFGRGAFVPHHVRETAHSLVWQALGIAPIAAVRTVVPAFHAWGDTRTPVLCSTANLIVFGLSAWGLVPFTSHIGIAIAVTLAGWVQLLLLLWRFNQRHQPLQLHAVGISLLRIILVSVAAGLALALVLHFGPFKWNLYRSAGPQILSFAVATCVGLAVLFAGLLTLCRQEVQELLTWILPRFRRK